MSCLGDPWEPGRQKAYGSRRWVSWAILPGDRHQGGESLEASSQPWVVEKPSEAKRRRGIRAPEEVAQPWGEEDGQVRWRTKGVQEENPDGKWKNPGRKTSEAFTVRRRENRKEETKFPGKLEEKQETSHFPSKRWYPEDERVIEQEGGKGAWERHCHRRDEKPRRGSDKTVGRERARSDLQRRVGRVCQRIPCCSGGWQEICHQGGHAQEGVGGSVGQSDGRGPRRIRDTSSPRRCCETQGELRVHQPFESGPMVEVEGGHQRPRQWPLYLHQGRSPFGNGKEHPYVKRDISVSEVRPPSEWIWGHGVRSLERTQQLYLGPGTARRSGDWDFEVPGKGLCQEDVMR